MTDARFASCRACGRAFTRDRWGGQSPSAPRLCADCETREREGHPHHAPGVECRDALTRKGA